MKSCHRKVDELVIFSEGTYIGNPIAKKKPPLPIETWTQYNAAGEEVASTIIGVDGWQYGLDAYFNSSRLNVSLLVQNWERKFGYFFKKVPEYYARNAPFTKKV